MKKEKEFVFFGQIPSKIFQSKYMLTIGEQIRKLREDQGLPLRKVAAELDIDQSVLSKIERGERQASKKQIIEVARIFNANEKELLINYLSDKVLYDLKDEDLAPDALKVAEKKMKYLIKNQNGK
jgi:transcriptional regulator with XRE-family HTH domain